MTEGSVGLLIVPTEEDNGESIDLPFLTQDFENPARIQSMEDSIQTSENDKALNEGEEHNASKKGLGLGKSECCYLLVLTIITMVICVGIYYSIPKDQGDDDDNDDNTFSIAPTTFSPTSRYTIVTMTQYPTKIPVTFTSSPIKIPTTLSPTQSSNLHSLFYCGATKEEAAQCQKSCALGDCPMFQYCFEISKCSTIHRYYYSTTLSSFE